MASPSGKSEQCLHSQGPGAVSREDARWSPSSPGAGCPSAPSLGKEESLWGRGLLPEPRCQKSHYQCLSHLYPGMEKGWSRGFVSTVFLHSAP